MIDITEKVTDYFQLEKVVTAHSTTISCDKCINYHKCQANRVNNKSLACRQELRRTYRENRYEGLFVTVERAIDWNVPPTEYERETYDAFMKLQKELETCVV